MDTKQLRQDAKTIYEKAIQAVLPDEAVVRALDSDGFRTFIGQNTSIKLLAFGKAAWQMANAARSALSAKNIHPNGIVITKYDHVMGEIPGITCFEAGHPVPDDNSFRATEEAIKMLSGLTEDDRVILLISGGGSALLEKPLIPGEELQDITGQLPASGADITEINTIRKRLSAVKGGRLAEICKPAMVFSVVLSDIIGDPLDMIASGPAYPDSSTSSDAIAIAKKYDLALSHEVWSLLDKETPKSLDNVTTMITGSVRELVKAASDAAASLGYVVRTLTDTLDSEAKDAGKWLAEEALKIAETEGHPRTALIAGGETVVKLTGQGKGGRNQELALAAARTISGHPDIVVFSVGSDGTDGPTDAAGGITDGETARKLETQGILINDVLANNDAYHALEKADGLIITGPTGTNVNDFCCALIG